MAREDAMIWFAIGLIAAAALVVLAFNLSSEARLRRRRRKSHSRIISTARQPTVKFSVKPPKE
jgi:hypothetical protein